MRLKEPATCLCCGRSKLDVMFGANRGPAVGRNPQTTNACFMASTFLGLGYQSTGAAVRRDWRLDHIEHERTRADCGWSTFLILIPPLAFYQWLVSASQ
jgi:hypothetical protein